MSHRIYTTSGIVLGSKNVGEANKFLYIFTRDLGMIGAVAQGIRLGASKLKYHAQDFSYSRFSVVRGKEVWRLTSAGEEGSLATDLKARDSHFNLYVRVLALLKRLLSGEEAHEALFDMLISGFTFITTQQFSSVELRLFETLMVFRILRVSGYVGKTESLEPFTGEEWSREKIESVAVHSRKMIDQVNRAIRESQL